MIGAMARHRVQVLREAGMMLRRIATEPGIPLPSVKRIVREPRVAMPDLGPHVAARSRGPPAIAHARRRREHGRSPAWSCGARRAWRPSYRPLAERPQPASWCGKLWGQVWCNSPAQIAARALQTDRQTVPHEAPRDRHLRRLHEHWPESCSSAVFGFESRWGARLLSRRLRRLARPGACRSQSPSWRFNSPCSAC